MKQCFSISLCFSLLLWVILIPSVVGVASANGGGYHHGAEFTGGIAPFTTEGTEQVQILDEELDIVLDLKTAKVSVRYQMKNVTNKIANVKFGFPVEDVVDRWDYAPPEKKSASKPPAYTKNYRVLLNGKELKHTYFHEPFGADGDRNLKPFAGSEVLAKIKGWQVSDMKLDPAETIILEIMYESQYDEENYSISDDFSAGPWLFRYRLSTGGVWNGTIKKGKVTVTYTDKLIADGVRVVRPVNRFKKTGKTFTWEFENLEPTLDDDIIVQAITQESEYAFYSEDAKERARIHSYLLRDDQWFLKHIKYSVTASSTLPDEKGIHYGAGNLKSLWNDVWSEGVKGDGIGEFLSFKLDEATVLAAISIKNGHHKSEKLFAANGRVKQIEVMINGKVQRLLDLPDSTDEILYFLDYKEPISSLKVTIKAVYSGSQYQDTCLTSFSLVEAMKSKPKTYGAR
ncbi:MAG: NADase-type glycan-binding domain-containing protein [Akkermansiaceae bacterium]